MEKNNQAVVEKTDKKAQKKNPNKKPNVFVRLWGKIKAVASELKKVTWPSFGETMKQLGAVIAVVLCFLVVLTLFDFVLGQGFNQFKKALGDDTSAVRALITLLTSRL